MDNSNNRMDSMSESRKRKKSSNKVKILTGKSLTRVEAIKHEFGMDLSTRVSELRADGVKIGDEYIDGKKLQKRYFMTQDNINEYNQSTTIEQ